MLAALFGKGQKELKVLYILTKQFLDGFSQ